MTTTTQTPWRIGASDAPLPPLEPGLPLLGIAHKMNRDPLAYFVELYKKHGPIFRVKLLNREIVVMAGLDANRFLQTVGDDILSSKKLFGSFGSEMDTDTFMTAMDGEAHQTLRKQSRRGYSRSAMLPRTDELIRIVDEYSRNLQPGDEIPVLDTLRHIVTDQLGIVVADQRPGEYFPYLRRFLHFNMNVNVLKTWPRFMLWLPRYSEAKEKARELAENVLAAHRNLDNTDRPRDLVDDLLAATDTDGQPYDENALIAATVGPFFAGIDTVAASLSFLMYNVLKYPAIHEAASAEAAALFNDSDDAPNLFHLKNMETLHGAAMENLRMYPVAPFTPRDTREPFEFHGYRVEAGADIYFAQTVTHYLDEFFSDPTTFDPHRFENGRGQPGAFAPYTLGAHLCLGAGIAETQMMLILARLLHNLRLELPSTEYEVTVYATPLPNPGHDFSVRVLENRMM